MATALPAVPVLLLQLLACSDALAVSGSLATKEGHGHRLGPRHHLNEAPQRGKLQREGNHRGKGATRGHVAQAHARQAQGTDAAHAHAAQVLEESHAHAAQGLREAQGHVAQAHARQAQGTEAAQTHAAQVLEEAHAHAAHGASDLGNGHSYDLDEDLAEGTDALLDFDFDDSSADNAGSSLFDLDAETDANGSEPKVNFPQERRMRMHKRAFEKDLEIKLELKKDVLATGKALGLKLNIDTDFEPVSIQRIKKKGLVEDFNKAHPKKALHVGDQIIQINDISWHHNSKTFAQRIKGQWLAARRGKLPTPFLTLHVQRPRVQKENRTPTQREDLHYQIYASDFTAQLRMPVEPVDNNMAKAMGWQLVHADDWKPVTIGKIKKSGIVAQYNIENPDNKLLVGDEVVEVDKINWHNNATKFMRRLQEKFAKTRNVPEKLRVLNLAIRRPRQVQEQYEKGDKGDNSTMHLVKRVFEVPLNVPKSLQKEMTMSKLMGWELVTKDDGPPVLAKIEARGLLAQYNFDKPGAGVNVGDAIIRVNGIPWRNNTEAFLNRIRKHVENPINDTLTLKFQRVEPRDATMQEEPEAAPASQLVGGNGSELASLGGVGADTSGAEPAGGDFAVEIYKKVPSLVTGKDEAQLMHFRRNLVGLATAWNKLHPDDRMDADFRVRGGPTPFYRGPAPAPSTLASAAAASALGNQTAHQKEALLEAEPQQLLGGRAAEAHAVAGAAAGQAAESHMPVADQGAKNPDCPTWCFVSKDYWHIKCTYEHCAKCPMCGPYDHDRKDLAQSADVISEERRPKPKSPEPPKVKKEQTEDVGEARLVVANMEVDITDAPFREAPKKNIKSKKLKKFKKSKKLKKSKKPKKPKEQDDVVGAEDDGDDNVLGASALHVVGA